MSATVGTHGRARRAPVVVDALVGLAVTGVLLAGLARPGFPLLRDWVATPDPPFSDAALGLGESAARAVPQDVAIAWASRALDSLGLPVWPLTGLLTAVFCVWLAVAAGALVRRTVPGAGGTLWLRLPAVVIAVWNPFVVERLLQGHWSLLAGVAAVMTMPVLLARAVPHSAGVVGACAALAAAGLTPTGWLLAVVAATVALACAKGEGRDRAVAAGALAVTAVVTALPWVAATVFSGAVATTSASAASVAAAGGSGTGVAAFAARAEPGIATVGSVVALGGIWNSEAVPPSRASWWVPVTLGLLLVAWALAARGLWRARRVPSVRATVPLALGTWLLVALAATGPGIAALDAVVGAVPGAGLLRDTQKFVALAIPATVLAVAFATRALGDSWRGASPGAGGRGSGGSVPYPTIGASVLVTAVALAAVPDAPRALWQQIRPVTYGPGWSEVAAIVRDEPGDLLVLPAGTFRSTPLWSDGRAVLDPAPRLLDTRVLVPGDLVVGGAAGGAPGGSSSVSTGASGGSGPEVPGQAMVVGEGDRARRATEALLRGESPEVLAHLGVRWVLDERTSAGPRGESARSLGGEVTGERKGEGMSETTTATLRFSDPELTLYEIVPGGDHVQGVEFVKGGESVQRGDGGAGGEIAAYPSASSGARGVVLALHAVWLTVLLVMLGWSALRTLGHPRRP